MARTLEEIDADIATLKSRLLKLSDPDRFTTLKHNGREMTRGGGSADATLEVRRQLRDLQFERSQVTGTGSPVKPVGA